MQNITEEAGIIRKLALLAIVFLLLSFECCLFVHGVIAVTALSSASNQVFASNA